MQENLTSERKNKEIHKDLTDIIRYNWVYSFHHDPIQFWVDFLIKQSWNVPL